MAKFKIKKSTVIITVIYPIITADFKYVIAHIFLIILINIGNMGWLGLPLGCGGDLRFTISLILLWVVKIFV
jgi:hypothetical protein